MVGEDNIADHGEDQQNGKTTRVAKDYFLEYFKSKATRYDQTRNHKKVSIHTGICSFCPEGKLVQSQSGYSNFKQHIDSQHQDMLEGNGDLQVEEYNVDEIQVEGEEGTEEEDESEDDKKGLSFWTVKFDTALLQLTIEEGVYTTSPTLRNRLWQMVAKRLQPTTNVEGCSAWNCRERVERLLCHYKNDHPKLNEGLDNETNSTRRELLEELSKIVEESGINVARESEESAVQASAKVNRSRRFKPYSTDKQSLASTRTPRTHVRSSSVQSPRLGYLLPEGTNDLNNSRNGVLQYPTTFSEDAHPEPAADAEPDADPDAEATEAVAEEHEGHETHDPEADAHAEAHTEETHHDPEHEHTTDHEHEHEHEHHEHEHGHEHEHEHHEHEHHHDHIAAHGESYHVTDSGLPGHHGHDGDHTWTKELMESRKNEDLRRRDEIALRRDELQVQRLRIDLEKLQWDTEKKEREARLALEVQERKILFDFMRKTLNLDHAITAPES